jgi:hypothetical protein
MNAVLDHAPRIISTQAGLQWLVLPGEAEATYTNFGDGRKGDASELVATVNADPAQNLGHSDWRLPTIDELKTLMGTADAPKTDVYWSSSPYVGSSAGAWIVDFVNGDVSSYYRSYNDHVRLVRARQ